MKKFDTSLQCEGCVNSIRKGLDGLLGEGNWQVNLNSQIKTLEIETEVSFDELEGIFTRVGHSISK